MIYNEKATYICCFLTRSGMDVASEKKDLVESWVEAQVQSINKPDTSASPCSQLPCPKDVYISDNTAPNTISDYCDFNTVRPALPACPGCDEDNLSIQTTVVNSQTSSATQEFDRLVILLTIIVSIRCL